jgi:hypothetical protein
VICIELVHPFSETDEWFGDYVAFAFAALYGATVSSGKHLLNKTILRSKRR